MPLCNTTFVAKLHFAQFPGPPPRVLVRMRNSRETGEVLSTPSRKKQSPEFSGKNQLILHVDASLTQQPGYRVAIQS